MSMPKTSDDGGVCVLGGSGSPDPGKRSAMRFAGTAPWLGNGSAAGCGFGVIKGHGTGGFTGRISARGPDAFEDILGNSRVFCVRVWVSNSKAYSKP